MNGNPTGRTVELYFAPCTVSRETSEARSSDWRPEPNRVRCSPGCPAGRGSRRRRRGSPTASNPGALLRTAGGALPAGRRPLRPIANRASSSRSCPSPIRTFEPVEELPGSVPFPDVWCEEPEPMGCFTGKIRDRSTVGPLPPWSASGPGPLAPSALRAPLRLRRRNRTLCGGFPVPGRDRPSGGSPRPAVRPRPGRGGRSRTARTPTRAPRRPRRRRAGAPGGDARGRRVVRERMSVAWRWGPVGGPRPPVPLGAGTLRGVDSRRVPPRNVTARAEARFWFPAERETPGHRPAIGLEERAAQTSRGRDQGARQAAGSS